MNAEVRDHRVPADGPDGPDGTNVSNGKRQPEPAFDRPKIRRDCLPCDVCQLVRDGELEYSDELPCGHKDDEVIWHSRPCIFVGCRPNLYLDVTGNGSIKMTRPELEPEEMRPTRSCVLDVAQTGVLTLDEAGWSLDVSRERIRQLEVGALDKYEAGLRAAGIEEDVIHDFPDREQGFDQGADGVGSVRRKPKLG